MIMDFKTKYLLAKKNGRAEQFRGDEISRRIAKRYPLSAQISALADRYDKPDEWAEYQTYRAECKEEVDTLIAEAETEHELL